MFAVNIRKLYFFCDKINVRHLRSRTKRNLGPGANPGLDNRLGAFREDGIKIQENDVEEFFEQSESSFYDVGEAFNAHVKESHMSKQQLRHHIVKDKYFKDNMPNLLTWSEKEQIRHLTATQPDEWTPQRIAESFPVTEQVVKKLLKYAWKPTSEERIARHDASAMRNWRELKEGTLDISENLRKHFLKFSERTIPPLNKKSIKTDISWEKMGEFEQIVQKCASNEQNNDRYELGTDESKSTDEIKSTKKDWKRVTLDELANKIKDRLNKGKNIDVPDKMIMDSMSVVPSNSYSEQNIGEIDLNETKEDKHLTEYKEEDNKVVAGPSYPERIRIPKNAYQKGATYKLNDCFYDHDGRFLYRVIGMTDNH